MKKVAVLFCVVLFFLVGCMSEKYEVIDKDIPFVASINAKDASISFVNDSYETIAVWEMDVPMMGALLIKDNDSLAVYGKDMDKITIYSLSEGKLIEEWETGAGITNVVALNDGEGYAASVQSENKILILDEAGLIAKEIAVGKSPDTMVYSETLQKLYVINFYDTKISVIDIKKQAVTSEITANKYAAGALIREDENELWVGGHGEGEAVEENTTVYDLTTGQKINTISTPIMPINFLEWQNDIFVVSHGRSTIHKLSSDLQTHIDVQIGTNPYSVIESFGKLLVASYDSDEIIVVDATTLDVINEIEVGRGPYKLLKRE